MLLVQQRGKIMTLYCVNGKCFLTDISSTPNCSNQSNIPTYEKTPGFKPFTDFF